jgi:membrane-associated phospholipid phosphatase
MTRYLVLRPGDWRLLLGACIVFALVTADVVVGGLMTHLDGQIRDQLITHGLTAPGALWPLGDVGDLAVAIAVVAAAAVVSAQVRWKLWPVAFGFGCLAVAEVMIMVSKSLVARPGPGIWADRVGYPGYYPSGHTTTAMVVVGVVAYFALAVPVRAPYREQADRIALVAGGIAGSAAGLYAVLGDFHWVSDIIGGLALGTAVLVVGCAGVRTRRDTAESVEHAR